MPGPGPDGETTKRAELMATAALSIFIPAYNAATTIGSVLARIPEDLWPEIGGVLIINDGSSDDTETEIRKLAQEYPKVRVLNLESNQGYGKAVRRGLGYCRELGSEYSVCLHADGQYPPEDLATFIQYMRRNRIDLLQGSRHKAGTARAGGMPIYKIVAGRALTWMENRCFDLEMTDYHSGFLIYGRRALRNIPFERLSGYFDFDLEVIATAKALGLKIDEVGIPTRYAGEKSHLNPIRYGLRTLRVMAKFRLGHYHAVPASSMLN